jgi:hypothetical protein
VRLAAGVIVAKIERVPLREVWAHKAHALTRWLEENPDVLTDAIGIAFVAIERERAAGAFSVDLVAEDDTGRTVVIENAFDRLPGPSDVVKRTPGARIEVIISPPMVAIHRGEDQQGWRSRSEVLAGG